MFHIDIMHWYVKYMVNSKHRSLTRRLETKFLHKENSPLLFLLLIISLFLSFVCSLFRLFLMMYVTLQHPKYQQWEIVVIQHLKGTIQWHLSWEQNWFFVWFQRCTHLYHDIYISMKLYSLEVILKNSCLWYVVSFHHDYWF